VRDSFAGFSELDVKGNDGSEKVDCGDAPEAPPGELGAPSFRVGCLCCSCRALARAFSCVRTKCASRLMNSWPSSESIGTNSTRGFSQDPVSLTCGKVWDRFWQGCARNGDGWWGDQASDRVRRLGCC
jgi:hypothetical protein